MLIRFAQRMLCETDPRLLWKFSYNLGWKGLRAVNAFKRRAQSATPFPAFLFLSLTNGCNLRCQGCWVTPTHPVQSLPLNTADRLISECKRQGSFFFGLLGGEPLLYRDLFGLIGRHPDCYFQVFTNGTLLTDEVAREMRRLGNVTPLISVEGRERVSDERRGGQHVYQRTIQGLEHCRKHRLITGVATSVCRSNIDDLVSDAFVHELAGRGVHYLWYYVYRPVGPDPSPQLALSMDEILRLRKFIVEVRTRAPIMIIDAYWDHEGKALCPAAVGISHHINPAGDIEPCPVVQFSRDNVGDGRNLAELFGQSEFLKAFRAKIAETTRGCILLDQPEALKAFLVQQGARDTSGRGTGLAELSAMIARPGHHLPGQEIPEKHWAYRFAKKHWFFGFGAYG